MSESDNRAKSSTEAESPKEAYLRTRQKVHAAQRTSAALGELSMFCVATVVALLSLWPAMEDATFGGVAIAVAVVGILAFCARGKLANKVQLSQLDLEALIAERQFTDSGEALFHVESGSSGPAQ